jgi:hypothetical protein
MSRVGPYTIAALVFLAPAAWSLHLGLEPEPFALSSAAVIAIGLLMGGLIGVAGLLLSRGRWSKNLGRAMIAATLTLAVVVEPTPTYWVALSLSALAMVGLTGPWLKGWVREFAAADGPGTHPVLLVFGALALVPVVGIASPGGLGFTHGVLGGAGVLLGWGYARAEVWALWGLRLALPVLAIGSILQSPWGGGALLAAVVGGVVWLAWTADAQRAVQPLLDRLPGPRVASPPGWDGDGETT